MPGQAALRLARLSLYQITSTKLTNHGQSNDGAWFNGKGLFAPTPPKVPVREPFPPNPV